MCGDNCVIPVMYQRSNHSAKVSELFLQMCGDNCIIPVAYQVSNPPESKVDSYFSAFYYVAALTNLATDLHISGRENTERTPR